jgi:hypothetical protein
MDGEQQEYEENERFREEAEWQQYLDDVAALECPRCHGGPVTHDGSMLIDVPGDDWYGRYVQYVSCSACGHSWPFDPWAP